jgi:hypothetical protein
VQRRAVPPLLWGAKRCWRDQETSRQRANGIELQEQKYSKPNKHGYGKNQVSEHGGLLCEMSCISLPQWAKL